MSSCWRKLHLCFLLLIQSICIRLTSSQSCSAINAYVAITSPVDLVETLLSSQALFEPYTYYIPPTELIQLESNDDPCDIDAINTDISNKIVLIYQTNGDCSDHYKVYVAEENSAIAVVLVYDEESNVINIIDDNSMITEGIETSIPMRSIPSEAGDLLSTELTSGETILIEFGCFTTDYASQICVLDGSGDYWWLDGEYQRQASLTYNDHPVWIKEGYAYLLTDELIFLHDADGDDDWYWAITWDATMEDDDYIEARCAVGGIYEPSLCPEWEVLNNSWSFERYSALLVNSSLCAISDDYMCINSRQSNLAGMAGTYRQYNPNTAFWFREWDDCDTRPGFFYFSDPYFVLYDPFNGWTTAYCQLNDTYLNSWIDIYQFIPSLCTNWFSMINGSLEANNLIKDTTFKIEEDTFCDDYECETTISPDTICMVENSVMHGFLEGEYDKTGEYGPIYNTPEYNRSSPLYYDGEEITIYLWWYGEIDDEYYPWWVISDVSLSVAVDSNGADAGIYGYCEATVDNPVDCTASWSFFYANAFHADDAFELNPGACDSGQATENYTWPHYACVGLYNDTAGSGSTWVDDDYFLGGYEINHTATQLSGGYPHWVKPENDEHEFEVYLFWDGFFGFWQIGTGLHVDYDVDLVCFQQSGLLPSQCNEWYDFDLTLMDNLHIYTGANCTAEDVLTTNNDDTASAINTGEAIGITLVIISMICCAAFFFYFYRKNNRGKAEIDKMNETKTKEMEISAGTSEDATAGLGKNVQSEKVDFTPINLDSPVGTPMTTDINGSGDGDGDGDGAGTTSFPATTKGGDDEDVVPNDDDDDDDATVDEPVAIEDDEDDGKKDDNLLKVDEIDNGNESQIEDDDEKKQETQKGIDSRRMSQQMLKAMQSNILEWTEALVEDPKEAARRYSRANQNNNSMELTLDPLFVNDQNTKTAAVVDQNQNDEKDPNDDKNKSDAIIDPLYDANNNEQNDADPEIDLDDQTQNENEEVTDVNNNNEEVNNDNNDEKPEKPAEWTQF